MNVASAQHLYSVDCLKTGSTPDVFDCTHSLRMWSYIQNKNNQPFTGDGINTTDLFHHTFKKTVDFGDSCNGGIAAGWEVKASQRIVWNSAQNRYVPATFANGASTNNPYYQNDYTNSNDNLPQRRAKQSFMSAVSKTQHAVGTTSAIFTDNDAKL